MAPILLIQLLFYLSDEQMKCQLQDRLNFQRLAKLWDSSQIPVRTTIWTFKERLIKAGAIEGALEAVNHQLTKHGNITRIRMVTIALIVRPPSIVKQRKKTIVVENNSMPID